VLSNMNRHVRLHGAPRSAGAKGKRRAKSGTISVFKVLARASAMGGPTLVPRADLALNISLCQSGPLTSHSCLRIFSLVLSFRRLALVLAHPYLHNLS